MLQNSPAETNAYIARRGRFVYQLFLCLGFWSMARGKVDGTLLLVIVVIFFISRKRDKVVVGIMGGAAIAVDILLAVVPFPAPLFRALLILFRAALEVGIWWKLVEALIPSADRQARFWSILWVVWSICNLYIAWIQCGFLLKENSVPSLAEMSQFDHCIFVVYCMLSTFGAPIFLYDRYALWRYLRSYDLNGEGKEK